MARRNFKTEQIVQHLRTHEINISNGMTREQSAKTVGVTPQTLVRWQKRVFNFSGETKDQLSGRNFDFSGSIPLKSYAQVYSLRQRPRVHCKTFGVVVKQVKSKSDLH